MKPAAILIVEGDILVRHPLAQYLRECGYRVLEATSAAEAREIITAGREAIGVVLIDVDPDDSSGFELANWIRARGAGCNVLIAGTVAASVTRAGALCDDGPALAKPYDHHVLLDRIRRLQGGRGEA